MCRLKMWVLVLIALTASIVSVSSGDVIPFCPYATLMAENITVTMQYEQGSIYAQFEGDFTLDDLWPEWGTMVFPIPANATDFEVARTTGGAFEVLESRWYTARDYSTDGFPMVQQYYPTVLDAMPQLPIKLWDAPSEGVESFHVSYKHELIFSGGELVFIYALGAEDFPHPQTRPVSLTGETDVYFDITIPAGLTLSKVMYDHTEDDSYVINGDHLILTPSGPLHDDLIVTFGMSPEPSTLCLLALGAMAVTRRRK